MHVQVFRTRPCRADCFEPYGSQGWQPDVVALIIPSRSFFIFYPPMWRQDVCAGQPTLIDRFLTTLEAFHTVYWYHTSRCIPVVYIYIYILHTDRNPGNNIPRQAARLREDISIHKDKGRQTKISRVDQRETPVCLLDVTPIYQLTSRVMAGVSRPLSHPCLVESFLEPLTSRQVHQVELR